MSCLAILAVVGQAMVTPSILNAMFELQNDLVLSNVVIVLNAKLVNEPQKSLKLSD